VGFAPERRTFALMATLDRLFAPDSIFSRNFFFLAKRFVPGETIADAIAAVRELNALGMSATLDFLGEDVFERDAAAKTRDAYLEMLDAIRTAGVDTNVSVKLTAMGMLVDEDFAFENLTRIVERASANPDPFVRIDMEGSAVTGTTLRIFERVFADHRNVGPVLQAYLKRTPRDVARAIELGARVRLCKGAYSEPPEIAIQAMPEIREAYLELARELLARGTYPGIATHDHRLIAAVKAIAAELGLGPEKFEFQMLFGCRPHVQRELVEQGYRVRIYVPFGTHWAGYFYRRVLERRENAFFALSSMFSR
jgi:proline dehydrogenase